MDSAIPNWPEGLPTPLLGRSHTIQPRSEVTRMESGRPRVRPSDRECLEVINATWNFTADQYNTFQTFFINELEHGEKVFELVTLEQAPDPTQVRQYVREVAFLDAKYTFTRSDNLFTVEAVLELDAEEYLVIDNPFNPPPPTPSNPDLPYTYTSTCRDTIEFSWELSPGFTPGEDILEAALSEDGPWYEYIVAVPTVEQLAAGLMVVLVNNSFSGARWFRVVRNGVEIYAAVNPVGSSVASPADISIDNTIASPYGLYMTPLGAGQVAGDSEPFVRPVSYIENSLISPTAVYVEPVGRREYYRGNNWDGTTNAVAATVPLGAELRWTRDGSDPTDTMAWPPPRYDGVDYNARAFVPDFALAVRLRCFSGECRSPLSIVLVDVRHAAVHMVQTLGAFSQYSGYCDLTRLDGLGNPQESGFSCLLNWGGTSGSAPSFQASVREAVCASLSSGVPLTLDGKQAIYRRISSEVSGFPTWMGWQGYSAYELRWLMQTFQPTGFRPPSFWDQVPDNLFEYAVATVGALELKHLAAGPGDLGHMGGSGGSLTEHCNVVETELLAFVPSCNQPNNDSLVLEDFELVLSLHNDEEVAVPVQPEPPAPPEPTEAYYELWESYLDTETAELEVLNEGVGWAAAWVMTNVELLDGYDLWDEVEDEEIDVEDEDFTAPEGGQGWVGAWVLHDNGDDFDYKALWEEFADAVILPGALPLAGGNGWAWFDEVAEIQEPWTFNDNGFQSGKDLMESYSDGVVSGTATVLDDNSDFSWEASGRWVFALMAPSSLTATRISDTEINLAWTDNTDAEDGFKVERKTGIAGTYVQIDTVAADVVAYADSGLTPETEYYYRVRAYVGLDNSPYSNEANATTSPTPPAAGVVLWLAGDAITGLSDTDPIDSWPAHMGSNATALTTARPLYRTNQINGLPAVQFDGVNDNMTVPAFFAGTETEAEMFVVVRIDNDPPSGSAWGMWQLAGGGDNNAFPFTDGTIYEGFASTVRKTVGNPASSLTSWRLYNAASAASDWKVRLDGTQIFTTSTNTVQITVSGAMGATRKLGQSGGTAAFLDGQIAELMVFDHVLSSDDRDAVEAYFSDKYGLTIA